MPASQTLPSETRRNGLPNTSRSYRESLPPEQPSRNATGVLSWSERTETAIMKIVGLQVTSTAETQRKRERTSTVRPASQKVSSEDKGAKIQKQREKDVKVTATLTIAQTRFSRKTLTG